MEKSFADRLTDLDMNSAVGNCEMGRFGSTIGSALGWDGLKFDSYRVSYFRTLVFKRISIILSGENEADPINVFVKQEPHKKEKLDSERYRLISAVSLVDTMIDRMLFKPLARKIIDRPTKTPCWVGWTPLLGGEKALNNKFGDNKTVSIDKSSWDWTMPGWLVLLILDLIIESRINIHKDIKLLMRKRFESLFRDAVFRFKDGTLVYQPGWGVMKSGCYLTLIMNSFAQSILHYVANIRMGRPPLFCPPITFGDDTLQLAFDCLEQYINELRKLGCIPKPTHARSFKEFIGFLFKDDIVIPAYWEKHIYMLEHADPENLKSILECYQILYAHYPPFLRKIQGFISDLCPEIYVPDYILKRKYYTPS